MEQPTRVAIIGGGMSGILAAIRLKKRGIEFTVYEKANRLGGTWRENTYPGITCDVPSQFYVYSFELNPEWTHRMSPGGEILEYFEGVAERHGVIPDVRLGEQVVRCTWLGEQWEVETSGGIVDSVDFVVAATGILHHPNVPDIEGLDIFEGDMFHSSRWGPRRASRRSPDRSCRHGLDRSAAHRRPRTAGVALLTVLPYATVGREGRQPGIH